MYIRQNAGVLTGEGSVDIVQRYSQIIRSVCFNQTMMVMIAACAVGIMVVYLIRRLSVDYAWIIAIVAGTVAQLLVDLCRRFCFRGIRICRNADLRAACFCDAWLLIYNFFFFSVDYTRTEYVQFEDDEYYYYVKAIPKMAVSSTDVKVQRISGRKRNTREKNTARNTAERELR